MGVAELSFVYEGRYWSLASETRPAVLKSSFAADAPGKEGAAVLERVCLDSSFIRITWHTRFLRSRLGHSTMALVGLPSFLRIIILEKHWDGVEGIAFNNVSLTWAAAFMTTHQCRSALTTSLVGFATREEPVVAMSSSTLDKSDLSLGIKKLQAAFCLSFSKIECFWSSRRDF